MEQIETTHYSSNSSNPDISILHSNTTTPYFTVAIPFSGVANVVKRFIQV